jgi:hypothetical protein
MGSIWSQNPQFTNDESDQHDPHEDEGKLLIGKFLLLLCTLRGSIFCMIKGATDDALASLPHVLREAGCGAEKPQGSHVFGMLPTCVMGDLYCAL